MCLLILVRQFILNLQCTKCYSGWNIMRGWFHFCEVENIGGGWNFDLYQGPKKELDWRDQAEASLEASALQAYEYFEAPFTIADSAYGSTLFVATGFHGLHVIIGTTFLATCLLRHTLHFSSNHHFGFEAAAWYWHFVDVVWLFL